MYLFGVAAATAVYLAAAPAVAHAQDEMEDADTMTEPVPSAALDETQQADYDSWSEEQKVAYATWPVETQNYYWSLLPERQMMFWRLTDEDKVALTAMTGPEREAAWEQVEGRTGSAPGGR
jgi:hypothetical protein